MSSKKLSAKKEKKHLLFWSAIYLPLLIILARFYRQDLNSWDIGGQFLAARYFRDFLWPNFSGWNPGFFGGFPQGYFYPSLFHWLVGGLGRLLPLEFCFKAVLMGSVLVTPILAYGLSRSLGFTKTQASLSVCWVQIILTLAKGHMGGDFFALFGVGLVSQQFAIPLFLLYLWCANEALLKRRTVYWLLAGTCLGLTILSHAFVGLGTLLVSLPIGWLGLKSKPRSLWSQVLIHWFAALAVGAAWLGPYFLFRTFQSGVTIGLDFTLLWNPWDTRQIWFFRTYTCLGIFCIFWLLIRKLRDSSTLILLILSLTLFLIFSILISLRVFPFFTNKVPIHSYRLVTLLYILFGLVIGSVLGRLKFEKAAMFLSFAFLYGITFQALPILMPHLERKAEMNLTGLESERILVSQSAYSTLVDKSPHVLSDTVSLAGIQLMNGLFVESSLNSPAIQSVMSNYFNWAFRWGVAVLPVTPNLVAWQTKWLGISALISDERAVTELESLVPFYEKKIIGNTIRVDGDPFPQLTHLYRLRNPLAEYLESPPRAVAAHSEARWEEALLHWWVSDREIRSPWIQADVLPESKVSMKNPSGSPTSPPSVRFIDNEHISVEAVPGEPRWIYLKSSYFPSWKAYEGEKEIPLYRATPNMIVFQGSGKTELRFVRPPLEWASYCISALGICFFGLLPLGFLVCSRRRES